jgi:hypothetical protein
VVKEGAMAAATAVAEREVAERAAAVAGSGEEGSEPGTHPRSRANVSDSLQLDARDGAAL